MTEDVDAERSHEETGLAWGVRSSFVRYVSRAAHGEVRLAGGAGRIEDGRFHFPLREAVHDVRAGIVRAAFAGSIRFLGHEGAIDLALTHLEVDVADGLGVLRSGSRDLVEVRLLDAAVFGPLASFRFSSHLAGASAHLFDGVYPAGADFDALEVRTISDPSGSRR
jgi:hypothetical protein